MHLDLHRWYRPEETAGVLTLVESGDKFYTIEKPWRNNTPFLSCIPEGNYVLVPHDTRKYPDTWAMVGGTVSHGPDPAFERYACVFHSANYSDQLTGCVGPGLGMQILKESVATYRSGDAMKAIRKALRGSIHHTLTIRGSGVATWG